MALIHATVGTLMPVLMVMMLTRFFGCNRSWTEGLSILPSRFSPGSPSPSPMPSPACCSAPSSRPSSAVWWAGPGGDGGEPVFWCPRTPGISPRERVARRVAGLPQARSQRAAGRPMSLMLAWLPYVALALLLVASRVSPAFKASLLSVSLAFTDLLGRRGQRPIEPLYLPGACWCSAPCSPPGCNRLPRPFGRALGSPAAP